MTPAAPYQAGDVVRVDVTALTPDIRVGVAYCGSRCGRIASSFADPTGAASARITIGANCRECHIVVSAGFHRVAVPVEFDATHYDWRRLGAGILLAATLLIVAWRLIAAVDWRPPSEADAPELDAPDVDVAAGGGPSRPSI